MVNIGALEDGDKMGCSLCKCWDSSLRKDFKVVPNGLNTMRSMPKTGANLVGLDCFTWGFTLVFGVSTALLLVAVGNTVQTMQLSEGRSSGVH